MVSPGVDTPQPKRKLKTPRSVHFAKSLATPPRTVLKNQLSASDALKKLKQLSNKDTSAWTPKSAENAAERAKILLSVRATGPAASQSLPATPTPAPKRPHADITSDTEDNLEEDEIEQRPKRSKPNTTDLTDSSSQHIFPSHPKSDRRSEYFVSEFRRLYREVMDFSHDYFGSADLEAAGNGVDPWAAGITSRFVDYAEQVAIADPAAGGWDALLRDTRQRVFLVGAILMKILKDKIFDEVLWGATVEQDDLLFAIDVAFERSEGFARQALRSTTIRAILGSKPVTQNFYRDTTSLTDEVSLLLKPLSDFLYRVSSSSPSPKIFMTETQYHALYNIISRAAYLSVCIRISPTIFHIHGVRPSTKFERDEHYSLSQDIFDGSMDAVLSLDDPFPEDLESQGGIGDEEGENEEDAVVERRRRILKEKRQRLFESHEPKVKISVWPVVRRFTPGKGNVEEEGKELREKRGFRIFDVCKGAVVVYYGNQDWKVCEENRTCLKDLVSDRTQAMEEGGEEMGEEQVGGEPRRGIREEEGGGRRWSGCLCGSGVSNYVASLRAR